MTTRGLAYTRAMESFGPEPGSGTQSLDDLNSLLQSIQLVEHRPAPQFSAGLAEKDRLIFQAAVAWRATHLLTGDRKVFGPFMNQPAETFISLFKRWQGSFRLAAGVDLLITAAALEHGLTVVTRNVRHFESTGVPVPGPFVPRR